VSIKRDIFVRLGQDHNIIVTVNGYQPLKRLFNTAEDLKSSFFITIGKYTGYGISYGVLFLLFKKNLASPSRNVTIMSYYNLLGVWRNGKQNPTVAK